MSRLERAARLLDFTRLSRLLLSAPSWSGVLVLNYHRIGDAMKSSYNRNGWSTPESLEAQLELIVKHFEVIALDDLEEARRSKRGRHIMVTLDDGYRDQFEWALPILRSHGVRATLFPITGFLDEPSIAWWDEIAWMVRTSACDRIPPGRWLAAPVIFDEPAREAAVRSMLATYKSLPPHATVAFLDFLAEATGSGRHDQTAVAGLWMTWDMVRDFHRAGMAIGGHTVNHPVLTTLSAAEQRAEIAGCRARIEAELGDRMVAFSYPGGRFNADTRACLVEQRIDYAFGHDGGYHRSREEWDAHDVPRTSISQRTTLPRFRGTVTLPRLFARW